MKRLRLPAYEATELVTLLEGRPPEKGFSVRQLRYLNALAETVDALTQDFRDAVRELQDEIREERRSIFSVQDRAHREFLLLELLETERERAEVLRDDPKLGAKSLEIDLDDAVIDLVKELTGSEDSRGWLGTGEAKRVAFAISRAIQEIVPLKQVDGEWLEVPDEERLPVKLRVSTLNKKRAGRRR